MHQKNILTIFNIPCFHGTRWETPELSANLSTFSRYHLSKSCIIQNRLVILTHSGKLFSANIEGIINYLFIQRCRQINRYTQIGNIQKLIFVLTVPYHRKSLAVFRPVIEESEYTKTLRSYK